MSLTNLITDIKTGFVTAAATIYAGVGTAIDAIPDNIGKLAALVGVVLSCILVVVQWRAAKKNALDIKIKEETLAELQYQRLMREIQSDRERSQTP